MLRKGRSRGALIAGAVTLTLSHAAVLWLGLRHGHAPPWVTPADPSQAEAEPSPEQRRAFTTELLSRSRAHAARDEIAAAEKQALEKIPWAERVAAARAQIPPDVDLQALLEKAIRDDEERSSPQTAALFDLWLDRDVDAALDWLGAAAWNEGLAGFDFHSPIARWLGSGDRLAQLPALLDRYYAAQEMLMESACVLMDERGAETVLALLRLFENGEHRDTVIEELIRWPLSRMAGDLPAVGALLGREELGDLLKELFNRSEEGEVEAEGPRIAEYLRGRFSGGLPAEYEDLFGSWERNRSLPDSGGEETPEITRSMEERVKEALAPGRAWGNYPTGFTSAVPDFPAWCDDAANGRMSPDEVFTRLRAAWPAATAAGMKREMEVMVFRGVFPGNPAAGLRWFRASGEDWGDEMSAGMCMVAPEQLLQLAAEFPDLLEAGGKDFAERCQSSLSAWYKQDPEGCLAGIRRAPASFLRDTAMRSSGENER